MRAPAQKAAAPECLPAEACFPAALVASFFDNCTDEHIRPFLSEDGTMLDHAAVNRSLRCDLIVTDKDFQFWATINRTKRLFPDWRARVALDERATLQSLARQTCEFIEGEAVTDRGIYLAVKALAGESELQRFEHTASGDVYYELCLRERRADLVDQWFAGADGDDGVALVPRKEHRHKRCAVVGSSYLLRGGRQGELISSMDAIFRSNWAPLEDFAADVGGVGGPNTTTYMVVNKLALRCNRHRPPTSCVSSPRHAWLQVSLLDDERAVMGDAAEHVPKYRQRLLGSALEGALIDLVKAREGPRKNGGDTVELSTGFAGAMLAALMCDEVHAFGFGRKGKFVHNYWTSPRVQKEKFKHSFEAERSLLRDVSAERTPTESVAGRIQQLFGDMRASVKTYANKHFDPGCTLKEGCLCAKNDTCESPLQCAFHELCYNPIKDITNKQWRKYRKAAKKGSLDEDTLRLVRDREMREIEQGVELEAIDDDDDAGEEAI